MCAPFELAVPDSECVCAPAPPVAFPVPWKSTFDALAYGTLLLELLELATFSSPIPADVGVTPKKDAPVCDVW